MNHSFLKILFVLAFPFLPLLLYISLPPSFPTSLQPSLPLPLFDCPNTFAGFIWSFFKEGKRSTLHSEQAWCFKGKKLSHRWCNDCAFLGSVTFHCRNSCYKVHFSSTVTKRRPMHFNHHLYKWAKFGAKNLMIW